MNHPTTSDNCGPTLPFAPYASDAGPAAVFAPGVLRSAAKTLRPVGPSFRKPVREEIEKTISQLVLVSRHQVDDFGQPRILSRFEATLHALAWPVMLGIVLGFGLTASLVVHHAATLPAGTPPVPSRIASSEAAP